MRFEVLRSDRRTISIEVRPDCRVFVRAPRGMSEGEIKRFVAEKWPWVKKHIELQKKRMGIDPDAPLPSVPDVRPLSEEELKALKKEARGYFPARCTYWSVIMGLNFERVSIKAQKTRWGSCSAKKNLNFNCLLMLAPEEIRDYVIIHELAHLVHMDHSKNLWALVARFCPGYKECRRWLRTEGKALIVRLS